MSRACCADKQCAIAGSIMAIILGIESSCDDTAAAVVRDGRDVLSSVVSTQFEEHQDFGGVVPELASRAHLRQIVPVVERALNQAKCSPSDLDAVAVTKGPGLIGSLLVGTQFAQAWAYQHHLPLIGVHHIAGHLYSVMLAKAELSFPAVGLVVSGGHTHLYRLENAEGVSPLGQTQDDAGGEAFDKVAKTLGLGLPGGPAVEKLAKQGRADAIAFPRAKMPGLDFSFSGLKTSVAYYVRDHQDKPDFSLPDVAASFQAAVADALWHKTQLACMQEDARSLILVGGVAQNQYIRGLFAEGCTQQGISFLPAPLEYCTDNAAMIAAAAYPLYQKECFEGLDFQPQSTLALS